MLQEIKEKAKQYRNQWIDNDTHIRRVFGGGEYPIREVDFRDRRLIVAVSEEKIQELRERFGENKRVPNLMGPKRFEVERDEFVLKFEEPWLIIEAPVWDYDITLFESVDEFTGKYRCRITDEAGKLESEIEEFEEKLKKRRQLQKDIS